MVNFKLLNKVNFFYFLCHNYRKRILNVSKSGRQAKQVVRVVKYKPVSDHKMNVSVFHDNSIQINDETIFEMHYIEQRM